jgi:hypothetical protein
MQEDRGIRRGQARLLTALALIGLGLPGIVSLLPALPEVAGVPRAALLINPVIILTLAAFLGAGLAPRCGFRSLIADRIAGRSVRLLPDSWPGLLGLGVVLGIAVTLADHGLAPLWQARPAFPPSLVDAWSPTALVIGLLYGGVVEEIVMRWGLTSVLVWLLWRILARRADGPPQSAILIGLACAALIFAAGHLPALVTAGAQLDGPLLVRTIGFNLALGVVFGWLFVRRDLESAVLGHIGFHLGVACAALPMRLAF